MDPDEAGQTCDRILDAINQAVVADRRFLEDVLCGILARGHILLEEVPGTGKTLTARSFADALGLSFSRIQFTPDLLPSDITGSSIYNEGTGEFEFAPGPIFANVVLADEINRAPPKTQAAMLESMGEKQVTVDGETNSLSEPFFVIATQNPLEQEGTFALPAAQRDRFIFKLSMGYPEMEGERTLLERRADRTDQTPTVDQVVQEDVATELQEIAESIDVNAKLRNYMVVLGQATRKDERVEVGISPRGIQRLFEATRAMAVIEGREYAVPDHIRRVVQPTFAHRLVLTTESRVQETDPREIINDILNRVNVPPVSSSR